MQTAKALRMRPRSFVCIHSQKDPIRVLKILQSVSEFGGLRKHQNQPACTKSVKVFKMLKLYYKHYMKRYVMISVRSSVCPFVPSIRPYVKVLKYLTFGIIAEGKTEDYYLIRETEYVTKYIIPHHKKTNTTNCIFQTQKINCCRHTKQLRCSDFHQG